MHKGEQADVDLVREAQLGDVHALGLLLARHQADMRAVALSILGHGPDAEDAVQDAALIALRRIGDVRDPHALAPWLKAVVRNACRTQLRTRRPLSSLDVAVLPDVPGLDELLDRHAVRDWIWHAMGELSSNLRLVAMLRYFTGVTTYAAIAEVCAIPVGTVRSRLSQARAKLSEALLATADLAHDDVAALTAARRGEAEQILGEASRGYFAQALRASWCPAVETVWPTGKVTRGYDYPVRSMENDLADGVVHRLSGVVAGRDIVIWEDDMISPPDDPFHCPPSVVWVNFLEEGRVRRIRLFHPRKAIASV
ncbi:sigma-70 family RNA polymerase sigma factor [Microbispora sp. RL4-1S]|uniref:Sigma-70 family RNA polymerase sigma factor n=1 Tax=Microbispora oryzae TaxID=2806554 RepID=A0A940WKE4_9ACTN|nr:sigma-70 family RNA polymerase sigma factor [Microbispora oryzae]MBP2704508.1 sigma-70 family RNA polymerase sigma factor [Microbispora oryzae]